MTYYTEGLDLIFSMITTQISPRVFCIMQVDI